MTDNSHPITPPPELVRQWRKSGPADAAANNAYERHIATQAARWGADQQLEQDAKWLDTNALFSRNLTILPSGDALRKEMRPKPPSLKEQTLEALENLNGECLLEGFECPEKVATIRRALESLPD